MDSSSRVTGRRVRRRLDHRRAEAARWARHRACGLVLASRRDARPAARRPGSRSSRASFRPGGRRCRWSRSSCSWSSIAGVLDAWRARDAGGSLLRGGPRAHRGSLGRGPDRPARASSTSTIPTPSISICSEPARCSSSCAPRARRPVRTASRAWLLAPAEIGVVRERQQAIAELRDRLDFREELWRLAESVSEGVHADRLRAWAARRGERAVAGAAHRPRRHRAAPDRGRRRLGLPRLGADPPARRPARPHAGVPRAARAHRARARRRPRRRPRAHGAREPA